MRQVDYNNPNNYKKTKTKDHDVYATIAPIGVQVYNFLDGVNYVTSEGNQVILSGTLGEQWVIPNGLLGRQYRLADGRLITQDALSRMQKEWVKLKPLAVNNVMYACFVPKAQQGIIQTLSGAQLMINNPQIKHGRGDFIVCSANPSGTMNMNDRRVVNGIVFSNTYDIRSFSDCIDRRTYDTETPKPKYLSYMSISGGTQSKITQDFADKVGLQIIKRLNKYLQSYGLDSYNTVDLKSGVEVLVGSSNMNSVRYSFFGGDSFLDVHISDSGLVTISMAYFSSMADTGGVYVSDVYYTQKNELDAKINSLAQDIIETAKANNII